MKTLNSIWRWPLLLLLLAVGCHMLPSSQTEPAGNPLFVSGGNQDAVWERVVDVLHEYPFQIAREDRLDGLIETKYKVGSGVLEPWHKESVGLYNRWESTLQSIRRRVLVSISQVEGGFVIGVEANRELEDERPVNRDRVEGTFREDAPLQRDLELVTGNAEVQGWIPQGRDFDLEQDMMRRLTRAFSR